MQYTKNDAHALFANDLMAFAQYFFPHLLKEEPAKCHKVIYDDLLSNHQLLAFEIFRGGAKSTIGLIINPIHHALYYKIGDISLISKSESFVLNEISRKIKWEFEKNKRLIELYGDQKTDKWAEGYFSLKNGISFEAKGIDGQLRGGRRGLIALDDLEDEETAISEEQRDKLKRRINKELIPKLLPKGKITYFGTPVHQLCYLHQIIQTPRNGWFKRVFPAYIDNVQEAGHEQWPEMFPHKRLQQLKAAMGSNYFATEYLCDPRAEETASIKERQIRYWDKLPDQTSCVIAIDPAYSEDTTADYKVAVVVAIDQNQNRYLVDYIRTHSPTGEFIDAALNLYIKYKDTLTGFGVPNSGVEKEFYRSVQEKAQTRRLSPPFCELKNVFFTSSGEAKRNKQNRIIAALQPLFEQGKYYIHPTHAEAKDELLSLTPRGGQRWDDIIDAMCYSEQILCPNYYDMQETTNSIEEIEDINRGTAGYGIND